MLTIGNVELGRIPRTAVPLSDIQVRQDAVRAAQLADIFELRIDQFQQRDPTYVLEVCRAARAHGVPLIATVRSADEGGALRLGDDQRRALYETVAADVDALDIEFHAEIRDHIVELTHTRGKLVIVSHHDFARTPSDEDLISIVEAAKAQGADIVKLAVNACSAADVDRLLGILRAHRAKQLIAISLGSQGTASRVFFPLLGSLLTYGFLDQAVAPGQLSLADLTDELCRYSPDFAGRK